MQHIVNTTPVQRDCIRVDNILRNTETMYLHAHVILQMPSAAVMKQTAMS